MSVDISRLVLEQSKSFPHWEVVKDCVDEMIDQMLNLRQSGHPGGSRSKVHALVATLLSGAMRWDLRRPWHRFGDRFVLVAGHTIPLVYATLAVLSEVLRVKHSRTGDKRYALPGDGKYTVLWDDLLNLRRRKGLPGHAEFEGKTLFVKFNTGPSGHGSPAAAGEALALKRAGADEVKVFAFEGEGGHTAGAAHETKNTAFGLGLGNLVYVLDWNDYGIDDNAVSSVVNGNPETWFAPYGWRTFGAEQGSEWEPVTRAILSAARGDNPEKRPSLAWVKTRKGRGYLKYDNKSHGSAHPRNSEPYWTLRKEFAKKYGVAFEGVDQAAPADPAAMRAEARTNMDRALAVLRQRDDVIDAIAHRLVEVGDSIPEKIPGFKLGGKTTAVFKDARLFDYEKYPASMYVKPGSKAANRKGIANWGAWINAFCQKEHGRPLFIACSADLAESTSISGFSKEFDGMPGAGWYHREKHLDGTLLPQQITEFTNSGVVCGMATVNMSEHPFEEFDGFYGACSTYGSFSYLKYGLMRLFSQLAQDCDLKVGKVLWIAGHSGPETAEDSRTHFGIFAPSVTQLFPDGHVIDLHPWEPNEVPVVLGAAFRTKAPIVALHLTRPEIEVPDREKLGMASHFAAAKGAYVIRPYRAGEPRGGCIVVQGTSTTANVVKILPELEKRALNVKLVAAISPQLFALAPDDYRRTVLSDADRVDSTVISNRSRRAMVDWMFTDTAHKYAMTSDWDDRWRTGGTVDDVVEEAHLSPDWLLKGIERFARERKERLATLRERLAAAESSSSG
jgi:transketolase